MARCRVFRSGITQAADGHYLAHFPPPKNIPGIFLASPGPKRAVEKYCRETFHIVRAAKKIKRRSA